MLKKSLWSPRESRRQMRVPEGLRGRRGGAPDMSRGKTKS